MQPAMNDYMNKHARCMSENPLSCWLKKFISPLFSFFPSLLLLDLQGDKLPFLFAKNQDKIALFVCFSHLFLTRADFFFFFFLLVAAVCKCQNTPRMMKRNRAMSNRFRIFRLKIYPWVKRLQATIPSQMHMRKKTQISKSSMSCPPWRMIPHCRALRCECWSQVW